LVGSPNANGNTAKLINAILEGAAENGAKTRVYNLEALNLKGCNACQKCLEEGRCGIDDDMRTLYREIKNSDAVILGSPVYMWQVTAQTKIFIDRLMAFLRPDFSSRLDQKKMILVFSQGSPDRDAFKPYFDYTAGLLYYLGFDILQIIVAAGTDNVSVSFQPKLLETAREWGRLISVSNIPGPNFFKAEPEENVSL
jgi:multimeric flavodoxin WrbA